MPITVKRLSDGTTYALTTVNPGSFVKSAKDELRAHHAPHFENGCRLIYNGKVLKSRHRLKHYGITDNGVIDMDDRKNWSSSSSDSGDEK